MKRQQVFVFVLLLFASSNSYDRIIGGNETEIENIPYIASLQQIVLLWVYHVCGASIISTKYLLTAAHCLPDNSSPLYARVGATKYNSGGQTLKVANFIKHPNQDDFSLDYDFAILDFEPGVVIKLGPKVAVIPLPSGSDPFDGSYITVAGWGYTSDATTEYSTNLKQVDLPKVNQEYCKTFYPGISPRQMCAAGTPEGNINFCLGDSGGPGSQNGVLYGVISGVSWFGCEDKNTPSVLARVSSVKDWITLVTGIE